MTLFAAQLAETITAVAQLFIPMATIVVAWIGMRAAQKAKTSSREANAAVNDVGTGELRIYEKVSRIDDVVGRLEKHQDDFDAKGWETGLPVDMNSAPKLTETIRGLQHQAELHSAHFDTVNGKLDKVLEDLTAHVEWEMKQKYTG